MMEREINYLDLCKHWLCGGLPRIWVFDEAIRNLTPDQEREYDAFFDRHMEAHGAAFGPLEGYPMTNPSELEALMALEQELDQ